MSAVEKYTLATEFEYALVSYLVTDRKVFGALRPALMAEAFPTKEAEVLVRLCLQVFDETGSGPGSSVLISQKLRHHHVEDGQITFDTMCACVQYMDDAIDLDQCPTSEAMLAQFVPQLQNRMRSDAMKDALMGAEPQELKRQYEIAETLGFVDTSLGSKLGASSFVDIARLKMMDRLPTGMPMLDDGLDGGAPRGQLFVWLGGTNSGKSTALGQQAGAGLREGALVLFGTNELDEGVVNAKIFSDLTGVPFVRILAGEHEEASKRYAKLAASGELGTLYVKELDTGITTPADIDDWRKEVEETEGRKVDLICIDYADRMSDGQPPGGSEYHMFKNIYNGLVEIAKKNKLVMATASASKDHKGSKYAKSGDMADSRHKGRIANVIVSLNPVDDEFWIYVCKQKFGRSDFEIGPVETDWEFGRVTTIPDRVQAGVRPSDDWQATEVVNALDPFTTQ